jgi:hypothetical protein
MEEAAEIQQAASKALRFGLRDDYVGEITVDHLTYELDDFFGVIELLKEYNILTENLNRDRIENKKEKIKKFMKYAEKKGALI